MKTLPDTKHLSLASILLAIFAGTYKVTAVPTTKIAEDEVPMGTIDNKLVQGLYSARYELATATNSFAEFLNDIQANAGLFTVLTYRETESEHRRLFEEQKQATAFFWETVRCAVPEVASQPNIAVRENWVVVLHAESGEPECPDCGGAKLPADFLAALFAERMKRR